MPFANINGARLYYETFGKDLPGEYPVLLIHQSTVTGRADWELVAPLLSRSPRSRRVIVPDCRGHGQSENPNHSYSFAEMAEDSVGLVRYLGYDRAHIVGHSNGGNVALVMLVEHPESVQTAVLQAANAYVSDDLRLREPPIFDPQNVMRENRAWLESMIALHGPTHGEEYWRELLRLTLEELLSQPQYTPERLEQVQRPTLVIQGAKDPVNAPAHHAEFLAKHIPFAEWWIPQGVSHHVHAERLFEWVNRVEAFWDRRGDEASEAVYRLKEEKYADDSQWIFDLRVVGVDNKPGSQKLEGKVLTAHQVEEAVRAIGGAGAEKDKPLVKDFREVKILLENASFAVSRRAVTDLRREPRTQSERVSQVLLGEAVRILEEQGDWVRVRLESDGYLAWMQAAAVMNVSPEQIQAAAEKWNAVVVAPLADAYSEKGHIAHSQFITAKIPFGVKLQVIDRVTVDHGGSSLSAAAIKLPVETQTGDTTWWIEDKDFSLLEKPSSVSQESILNALKLFRAFVGVPYLWGGRTPFGFDCSGLAQTFYHFLGLQIPRDAHQQFDIGVPVSGDPQPGDLLFFGPPEEQLLPLGRNITHVAISLGGWEVLHANGTEWRTSINSLEETHPGYRSGLKDSYKGTRRFR